MRKNLGNRTRGVPNKPGRQARSYPLTRPIRAPLSHEPTVGNIFGAFDPYNQAYVSTKAEVQYDNIPSGYDGFFPKSTETNRSRDFPSTTGYDYSQSSEPYVGQTTNYSNQSQPMWQYPTEPQYDQQQYSNPQNEYIDPMCM